jgi:putative ABC transport system ATP-binding protein
MFKVEQLSKIYNPGGTKVRALDGVSFNVTDGDMLIITGRSGSGKSTLLRLMGLLDYPTSGEIYLENERVTRLRENKRAGLRLGRIGYVFQEYALLGELTAHQNVYLPGMMLGLRGSDYKEKGGELLNIVGMGQRINHYPRELSGGEQQRVAIARALINNPRYLLADEPCANLDTISSRVVMETMVRLNREMDVTVIFVSHDPDDRKYARSALSLSDGKIVETQNYD